MLLGACVQCMCVGTGVRTHTHTHAEREGGGGGGSESDREYTVCVRRRLQGRARVCVKIHSIECVLYRMSSLSEDTHIHTRTRAHAQCECASGCEVCTVHTKSSHMCGMCCCAPQRARGWQTKSICCPSNSAAYPPLLAISSSTTRTHSQSRAPHRKLPQLFRTSPAPLPLAPTTSNSASVAGPSSSSSSSSSGHVRHSLHTSHSSSSSSFSSSSSPSFSLDPDFLLSLPLSLPSEVRTKGISHVAEVVKKVEEQRGVDAVGHQQFWRELEYLPRERVLYMSAPTTPLSVTLCATPQLLLICHVSSSSYDMYPPPHMPCILLLI